MYEEANLGSASPVGAAQDVAFGALVFGVCILVLGIWMLFDVATGPALDGRYAWLNRWLYDSFGPRAEAGALILSGTVMTIFSFYSWLRRDLKNDAPGLTAMGPLLRSRGHRPAPAVQQSRSFSALLLSVQVRSGPPCFPLQ